MLDVDNFKGFNDSFGHPAGDEILKSLAGLLVEHSRATDFAARYGGEEFAVLLPNTDKQWSLFLAERLRAAIEGKHWPLRPVTASFGAATFHDPHWESGVGSQLIEAADQALYHSKRNGRNRVAHSDDIKAQN